MIGVTRDKQSAVAEDLAGFYGGFEEFVRMPHRAAGGESDGRRAGVEES